MPTIVRVADYLDLLNHALFEHIPSADLLIEGEVSDFRVTQQKWVSFDLKDEEAEAVLKCFMTVWQMGVPIENGMRVRVNGFPKVYERFGTLKLNVQRVEPVGEGALKRAYELLKKKLEEEGVFDLSRKRGLPRFPERVGLITSRDAAAFGDFLRIMNNRWVGVEIDFVPVHVQGRQAVPEILQAFAFFNGLAQSERPDVLVLTRGGGGLEDLHAFNDEQVVRAVFLSKIPVVCGVGHERDESLCDFAADVRASTPSNAAERIVPDRREVAYEIQSMTRHMDQRVTDMLAKRAHVVAHAARAVGFVLQRKQEQTREVLRRLLDRVEGWLPPLKESVGAHDRLLRSLDPRRLLARGYSIVTVGGAILKDASVLDIGGEVGVQLASGSFDAEVIRVNGRGKRKLL
ncbi:MAG: Exodeoxyribonuclease 7 large subunit [Candidatus Uhrbacteria bacterium GW2011_GWA2_53_10]|uniref:Exodeoxyribonuclease 7 large subunit n=1 Tax=Candidatus Uhrbacteria bacterium GW2011_GWA2_53_10 TaxID=1618980 RepID=A0A0G1XNM9_9BACT|nr:MAG: Exodeoxyribonuclease 7 large subunit [Candidatus Uhrbacteria bacterium GW2011_GWA2_53_10]